MSHDVLAVHLLFEGENLMMSFRSSLRTLSMRRTAGWLLFGLAAAALGAGGTYFAAELLIARPSAAPQSNESSHGEHGSEGHGHDHGESEGEHAHESGKLVFPQQKWKSAGIRLESVRRGPLQKIHWVTGKLTLNQDRTAHIYSLVEGRIHTVGVQFGEDVDAGDVLAVVQSREVGDAKLQLYRSRLEYRIAKVNAEWAQKINDNTQALIRALEEELPLSEVEVEFRDKPMGEYREKLLTAFADLYKARADYERLKPLTNKGITSGAQLLAAQATYEAARAKFSAWLEQLKFTAWQASLKASQVLDRYRSEVEVNQSRLLILGYTPEMLAGIDPATQGETLSHYEVRAPFAGTILRKDATVGERVGPNIQLFQLADLSTLWLQADIYQSHLPELQNLSGDKIRFRSAEYEHLHEARIFYRGEIFDPETRTARLMAIVENTDRHLKPGMFVEVELPGRTVRDALQIPASAVMEHEGETFVFVHEGGENFERRDVVVGPDRGEIVEISSGLQEGESVVVEGAFALKSQLLSGLLGEGHAH